MIGARERNLSGLHATSARAARGPTADRHGHRGALRCRERATDGPIDLRGRLVAGVGDLLWVTRAAWRRHIRGVYVSAAFFALVHSAVWPTPIPLFFLGLGLGWLAVRTRGILRARDRSRTVQRGLGRLTCYAARRDGD